MTPKTHLILLILLYFTIYSNCEVSIPSFVHLCKQSDPDIDKCILNTVNELKPNLAKGIPEMKIPPLSPFKIEKISFKYDNNLEMELTDVELGNLMSFDIEYFHVDVETIEIDVDMKIPLIDVKGMYNVKGRMLAFELNSSGNCDINLNDVSFKTKIYGKRIEKEGKEYFDFNNIDVDVQLSDGHVDFQNLFAGNQELTDHTNRVLNQNLKTLLPEFQPIISSSIKDVILTVIKDVFDSFPAEELLPK